MQIKPIYTVHGPNHNKTNFKGNQVKKATFRQPRPQGFSLKKMGGAPFFKGKALGTRLTFRQLSFKVTQLDFLEGIPPKFEQ